MGEPWVEEEVEVEAEVEAAARDAWVDRKPLDRTATAFAPVVDTKCRTRLGNPVMNESALAAARR